MMSHGKIRPKAGCNMPEERVQGKRLLIAHFVLLLMFIASAVIAVALTALWIFWRFSTEDLIASWDNPYLFKQHPYLIYLPAIFGIMLIWTSYDLWKRIFYRSGYISQRTQQQFAKGVWPVIGGYWKPFGYVVYIGVLSYGAYLGYEQEGLWALVLTLAFVFWLIYLAWIDLMNFRNRRRSRDTSTRGH